MDQIDFEFDPLEFRDRSGIIRKTWGYSIAGRAEFWQRLAKLGEALEEEMGTLTNPTGAIARLYDAEPWFRHNCDRCLELNNIDPDWLDGKGKMLAGLLFQFEDGPGLLVKLNQPDPVKDVGGEPGTMHDAIAALAVVEGGFEPAWRIANAYPEKLVNRYVRARSNAVKPPEEAKEDEFKEWARRASGIEQFKAQSTERN